jgi:hypothetical protein
VSESPKPPARKDFSEQNAWIYGGVGTAAFSTVLGAGLFGFYEDHTILGTLYTVVGVCGLAAMIFLLRGHRLTLIHTAIVALLATWALFGYDMWSGPARQRAQPTPPTISEDEKLFRSDLRQYVRSSLQDHFESCFALADAMSQEAYPSDIDNKTKDAAARLLKPTLKDVFRPSWTNISVYVLSGTIENIDVKRAASLVKDYINKYNQLMASLGDYLQVVGPTEDRGLLQKCIGAENRAASALRDLQASIGAIPSGLINVGSPSGAEKISPFVLHK